MFRACLGHTIYYVYSMFRHRAKKMFRAGYGFQSGLVMRYAHSNQNKKKC